MGKSHDLATGLSYQDLTETDARYHTKTASNAAFVAKAGDTMTGALTVGGNLTVNTDADTSIEFKDGGTNAAFITAATGDELYIGANNEYAIRIKNDGTKDVSFDNGSRVTMPSQPAFNIVGTQNGYAARITAGGTTNAIPFNLARGQGTSGFNTSNGVYTAPVTGTYLFMLQTIIQTGANHEIYMYKNGTLYARHYPEGGRGASFSSIIPMAENDYIVFGCDFDVYMQHTTSNYSSVSIALLG